MTKPGCKPRHLKPELEFLNYLLPELGNGYFLLSFANFTWSVPSNVLGSHVLLLAPGMVRRDLGIVLFVSVSAFSGLQSCWHISEIKCQLWHLLHMAFKICYIGFYLDPPFLPCGYPEYFCCILIEISYGG